jgi:hypothetical protein
MGVVKRSVSFDADIWDELVGQAGAGPVSTLVNDALAHYLRRQRGLEAISGYEAEFGAFTDAELAEADRILDAAGILDLTTTPPRKPPKPRKRAMPAQATARRSRT